jgi:ribosomal-protein-serine acetyltransferase
VLALQLGNGAEVRALESWHADEFAAHVERVREHLKPWIPFASRVIDVATARELLQDFADRQARDTGRMFGIWIDDQLSGGVLFRDFDAQGGVCEIGVWLAPGAEGRGVITATVRHMLDWAFRVRGIQRVEWNNSPDNVRSQAVAKRLGLTCEGIRRSDFVVNGQRQDSETWSILAHEWRELIQRSPSAR